MYLHPGLNPWSDTTTNENLPPDFSELDFSKEFIAFAEGGLKAGAPS